MMVWGVQSGAHVLKYAHKRDALSRASRDVGKQVQRLRFVGPKSAVMYTDPYRR